MRSGYGMLFVIFITTFNVFVETGPVVPTKPKYCPIEECGCHKDCSGSNGIDLHGYYASCDGCDKYVWCVPIPGTHKSQVHVMKCPPTMAYDPRPDPDLNYPCSVKAGYACKKKKPGICPPPFGFGICLEQCSGDFECPENQKCCSNGCGNVCTIPISSGPATSPGTSPVTSPQTSPTPRPCPNGACCFYTEADCKSIYDSGLYAKCYTCGKYFNCPGSQQTGYGQSCGQGTRFDFQKQTCVHDKYCNSGPQPEPTYWPPSPTTTYPKPPTCPNWQTDWRSCCITDCWGRPDGDYQSCKGCNKYVTCSHGNLMDNRPCAAPGTYWDDVEKACVENSKTCFPSCVDHGETCCKAPAGECVDLPKGYKCRCRPGYEGDGYICKPTGCVGFTCNGQYEECAVIDGGPKCVCVDGYKRETPYGPCVNIDNCNPDPCLNYGKCVDGVDSYTCKCTPRYEGDKCEIDKCNSLNCGDYGTCKETDSGVTCDCDSGYYYDTSTYTCENKDECNSNPCKYGSTCVDKVNDYMCVCAPDYTGKNCGEKIDDCASNPCKNDGTCKDGDNTYTCMCTPRYEGPKCEYDKCDRLNCGDYGECVPTDKGVTCKCDPGYYYDTYTYTCENKDDCEPNPCVNGACVDKVNDYKCMCRPDYTGRNCEQKIDNCKPNNPCKNGGTCYDGDNAFTCQCTVRYYGDTCEKDKCDDLGCGAGSYCTVEDYVVKCVCKDGYVLDTSANTFTCIDPCAGDKCGYGECSPTPYGNFPYTCDCDDGYFLNPATNECGDPCSQAQCGSGSCIPSSWSYTCKCDADSYFDTGSKMCKNPCDPIFCGVGYCVVKKDPKNAGDYECNCAENYVFDEMKKLCVDPCEGVKCGDYGTCQRSSGTCKCTNGYVLNSADNTCEDPCQGVYCGVEGAGSCMRPSGICKCNPGYEPDPNANACIEINECVPNPCKHGSTCMDKVNGYKCVCKPNYQGTNCDKIINPCLGVTCVNGDCIASGQHHFCQCRKGYKKDHKSPNFDPHVCEDINECEVHQEVCSDLAECSNTPPGHYNCTCSQKPNSKIELTPIYNKFCYDSSRCEILPCSAIYGVIERCPVGTKSKERKNNYWPKPLRGPQIGNGCTSENDYYYDPDAGELVVTKLGCCASFILCDCSGLSGEDLKLCTQKEREKKFGNH